MSSIILISQSNTQTMIYPIRTIIVQCDHCKAQLKTNAASEQIAREVAESKGWLITNKGDWLKERHYCPNCKEAL